MTYQSPQGLASLGRNGDSMLVHMNPTEVAGLQSLAMAQGGSLTINPQTGLPEAFSLGGFFKGLLPMFAGMATGGAGMPLWAGIAAGAATGALTSKDKLMGAITGGFGGYGGYNLGQGFAAAAAPTTTTVPAAGGYVPGTVEGANTALNVAGTYNPALSPSTTNLMNQANAAGFAGSAATGATGVDKSFLGGLNNIGPGVQNVGTGMKNVFTGKPGAFDAFKASFVEPGAKPISDLAAYGKIAMPIGGGVLSGLEPSDIYGEPINMASAKSKEAYDPYATLNLGGSSGLRLVAEGGYIDGYATGGTIQSGGIRDLYGSSDNQLNGNLSSDGYGLGRLSNLANEQAMTQAQTRGYAMGGPISFADGGDTDMETLGLPSLTPDANMVPNTGSSSSLSSSDIKNIMQAVMPFKGMKGNFTVNGNTNTADIPAQDDSLITKVMTNLKNDPNYQPANPLEEAIVKQMRGSTEGGNTMAQGLGSLAPSTPTAPSFNASTAMTPTYYAGMNAPRGYAEGGETSMNLNELPTLNVETGKQISANELGALQTLDPFKGKTGVIYDIARAKDKLKPGSLGYGYSLLVNNALQGKPTSFSTHNSGVPYMAKGGYLNGAGDGMSDSIPATIEGKQPARLADGEFVVPADVVSHLGNGSSKAGSQRLYAMMDRVRKARTGHTKQGKQIKPEKYMPV